MSGRDSQPTVFSSNERMQLLLDAADDCIECACALLNEAPNLGATKEARNRRLALESQERAGALRAWAAELEAAPETTGGPDRRDDELLRLRRQMGEIAVLLLQNDRDEVMEWARGVKLHFPDGSPELVADSSVKSGCVESAPPANPPVPAAPDAGTVAGGAVPMSINKAQQ